ncbi:MAG: dTDP-4-dehydrorhamnose 3,5-epimerase family protein [Methylococcales bacterium]
MIGRLFRCAKGQPPRVESYGSIKAFPVDSLYLYSVSNYWDMNDELGCRWNDPDIGIDWPADTLCLSERDRNAPSLELVNK